MLKFLRQDGSPVVAFDRARYGGVPQHAADGGLLLLDEQPRHHGVYCRRESVAPKLPSVCRTPFNIVDVGSPERAPHVAAGNGLAAIEKYSVGAGGGELRINVDAPVGDHLERSFAFNKASEPRPFTFGCHAEEYSTLNPEYAAIAERRINADAGMFAKVEAA